VFVTKVQHGAWLAVAAMVVLFVVMKGIRRYYARVEKEIAPENGPLKFPSRVHAIVLVSRSAHCSSSARVASSSC